MQTSNYPCANKNTLHQGATLSLFDKPHIETSMLYPLLAMIAAFVVYYVMVLFMRMQNKHDEEVHG